MSSDVSSSCGEFHSIARGLVYTIIILLSVVYYFVLPCSVVSVSGLLSTSLHLSAIVCRTYRIHAVRTHLPETVKIKITLLATELYPSVA